MSQEESKTKFNITSVSVAVAIVISMLFYFFTFQVRVTERAVVTTFGRISRNIDTPGLYWKWPYPFQKIHKYDSRLRVFESQGMEQMMTKDNKSIIVLTYVGWRITNVETFIKRVGEIGETIAYLEPIIRTQTSGVINQHPFSHLISNNRKSLRFEDIEHKIRDLINNQEGGAKSLGIEVEEFGIKRLIVPKDTTTEIFNRMREERNGEAEKYRSQGEGESLIIRNKADAEKRKIIIEAEAEAKKIRGQGIAAAAEKYKIFAQEKELALWIRKIEALEKILDKERGRTLVVDPQTLPFDILRDGYKSVLEKPSNKVNGNKSSEKQSGNADTLEKESNESEQKSSSQDTQNTEQKQKSSQATEDNKASTVDNAETSETSQNQSETSQDQSEKSESKESSDAKQDKKESDTSVKQDKPKDPAQDKETTGNSQSPQNTDSAKDENTKNTDSSKDEDKSSQKDQENPTGENESPAKSEDNSSSVKSKENGK